MPRFLILYKSPMSFDQQMDKATPEEVEAGMEPWMAWFSKYQAQIFDIGAPLAHGKHFTPEGSSDSDSHLAGYTIVEAASMDAIKGIVEGHPHFLSPGNTLEVHEVMPMG